ncbi:type IV secretion system protein TraC [Caulobacter sp. 17J65-9]|uniref:type IV secretion system protein TraC n=1 Tax=Caulobacter sp. 17J65-9 TaxID=2709382 RepID=UPI0013CD6B86|nr:type IV secretion system protein TraC [Caulobacter sp. 17J65-9]NEX91214.1 type IV secretion system protein TraC [Caulobacter sp. 17J65-9]
MLPGFDFQKLAGDALQRGAKAIFDEPPPAEAPRGFHGHATLSALLPYRQWDAQRELFVQDKSLGWVLEVIPLVGSDDVQARMLEELCAHAVPQGATCQIITYASPKIGDLIGKWAKVRARQGGVFEELGKHRYDFLRKGAWESASAHAPFYFRDFRIFIAVEMDGTLESEAADELTEARAKFAADFKAMRSFTKTLHPADLIDVVGDILNPSTNVRRAARGYDDTQYLNEQMVGWDTRYAVFRDRIDVAARSEGDDLVLDESDAKAVALIRESGGKDEQFQMRGFAVRKFPRIWSQARMSRLLGDMFNDQLRLVGPTLIVTVFTNMTPEKSRSTAEFKRIRTTQAASNRLGGMVPETRKAAEEWSWVMEDVAEGALLGHVGMFILTVSPKRDAVQAERQLRAVWRSCGFDIERHDDIHLQTLLTCLPLGFSSGMAEDLQKTGRVRRMPSTVSARLAPLQGEFLGYPDTPHMLFSGRRGQLFYYSIFGNSEGNHNCAVVGSSGSGKSVLMQDMAASLLGAGAHVMVIDDGFSFRNSCLLLDGAFIQFDLDKRICINPFSMIDEGFARESPDYLVECKSMLLLVCTQMARGDRLATDEEAGALERVIGEVWEAKGASGTFDDVVAGLMHPDFGERGRDLALSMQAYTSKGTYGGYFNGRANLDMTNPYTVFEMSDLESKPALRAVVILALLFMIRQRMKVGGREQKKALIIDEAWQLLSDGATGKFIEGMARRCRKEGGAIITGTQSLNDYYKTAGATACIENSDHVVVLRLKDESLEQFRENARLKISEPTMVLMKSLKVVEGEYSEMVIMVPGGSFLGRLILDPYSATLYSSKPNVFAAIDGLRELGWAMKDAVREVAYRGAPAVLDALQGAAAHSRRAAA